MGTRWRRADLSGLSIQRLAIGGRPLSEDRPRNVEDARGRRIVRGADNRPTPSRQACSFVPGAVTTTP
jgi:hypothetical protein